MHAKTGLSRLSGLLGPGGVLAVVGLARSSLSDLPIGVAAIVPNRLRRRRGPYCQHGSPTVWPPPESYAHWRYTLVSVKP